MAKKRIDKKTFGVVCDCFRLNIRKEPSLASDILSVVPVGMRLEINTTFSDAAWYKVTIDEKEGFALKQYVRVREVKKPLKSLIKPVSKAGENDGKHPDID